MHSVLLTRNAFIDTSVFKREHFDFSSRKLKSLHKIIDDGHGKIYITNIVQNEVEKKIREDTNKALDILTGNKIRILKNLSGEPFIKFFQTIDAGDCTQNISSQLIDQFHSFLRQYKVEIIATDSVSIPNIFADYFAKAPPFGEGSKAKEFPDAFSFAALSDWCKKNGERMYVISSDNDLAKACEKSENLFHLESIPKFIDLLVREDEDEKTTSFIEDLFSKTNITLVERIRSDIEGSVYVLGDRIGTVNNISIEGIEILNTALLDVQDDIALVEVETGVHFEAETTYKSTDEIPAGIRAAWFEDIHQTIRQEDTVFSQVIIRFDQQMSGTFQIEKVIVNDLEPITIWVDTP